MKTSLFATLAATVLTATSVAAAPLASPTGAGYPPYGHDHDSYAGYNQAYRPDYREHDRWNDGDRDARHYEREQAYGYPRQQNYGYARNQQDGYYQNQGYGYASNQGYGYNQGQYYGYARDQRVIVQPQPQYRRPAAVSIRFGIY